MWPNILYMMHGYLLIFVGLCGVNSVGSINLFRRLFRFSKQMTGSIIQRRIHFLDGYTSRWSDTNKLINSCTSTGNCGCKTSPVTPETKSPEKFVDKELCSTDKTAITVPMAETNSNSTKSLFWYVIGEGLQFSYNKLHKIQVWDQRYVVWRSIDGKLHALADACSHRSASLSNGQIVHDRVSCPYHGYEFDTNGTLVVVPGIPIEKYHSCFSVQKYDILEKNGWVYLNILPSNSNDSVEFLESTIYSEPEATMVNYTPSKRERPLSPITIFDTRSRTNVRRFKSLFLQMDYDCYSRILSENILDLMHIPFTHTFGNIDHPAPIREESPVALDDFPYHYRSRYIYKTGNNTIANFIFGSDIVTIENEFVMPHTTISRVIFDGYVKTVVTSVLPIGNNQTRMFAKVYRNFWIPPLFKPLGDILMYNMMYVAMLQDKKIVDNIDPTRLDGKFSMKYDRLQYIYRTLFRKYIHEKV